MSNPDELRAAIAAQITAFVDLGDGAGKRSVLIKTLGDPQITVTHEADRVLPAASLAKMILGVALFEAGNRGDLDTRARIGDLSLTRYPSVLQALDPETTLTARELCGLSLVNVMLTACRVQGRDQFLAEHSGLERL